MAPAKLLLAMIALPAAALPPSRETLFSVDPSGKSSSLTPVQPTLKDVSGMAYIGQGTFVVVHDMKADENPSWPRVSLVQIPYQLATGLQVADLSNDQINWPTDRKLYVDQICNPGKTCTGPSFTGPNDLESAAGIPGTTYVLLCESTNSREDTPTADRM